MATAKSRKLDHKSPMHSPARTYRGSRSDGTNSSSTHLTRDAPETLRRFLGNFRWEGIDLEAYKISTHKKGEFCGASRQVVVGKHDGPAKFHVRYFELERGGFTSLESHRHCHLVIGLRGRGSARVGERQYEVRPFDILYIGPHEPHQLRTTGRAPFGFFCIVDAVRDRPQPLDP
jgi:ribulose-bisphosphate carboxylase large chain